MFEWMDPDNTEDLTSGRRIAWFAIEVVLMVAMWQWIGFEVAVIVALGSIMTHNVRHDRTLRREVAAAKGFDDDAIMEHGE